MGVKMHAKVCMFEETCIAQDSLMMYKCIIKSISSSARNHLNFWKYEFTGEHPKYLMQKLILVPLCLKFVIFMLTVDTTGTMLAIHDKLNTLYLAMPAHKNKIKLFNMHGRGLLLILNDQGETFYDLFNNLFCG